MSERQLFPELKLIKKEVLERFLLVLYGIYEQHPHFTYHHEENQTKIWIYPSYADSERDGVYPRMIIKAGSYGYGLMDTMNNNMSGEIYRDGVLVGLTHQQIINTTLTVLVQANYEEECSDIADELVSLVVFAMRNRFRGSGLIVRGSQVSETDLFNKEQDVYQTNVTFSFDVPWTTSMEDTGLPIDMIDPELDLEDPLEFEPYRSPGVTVVQQKREDN